MSTSVLVTGSAGFIGSNLCLFLKSNGYDVLGIDCLDDFYSRDLKWANVDRLKAHGVVTVWGNVLDREFQEGLISRPIDVVCHLAARPGARPSWESLGEYLANNVLGTDAVIRFCLSRGIPLINAGSSSIYGECPDKVSESLYPVPTTPYGVSKLAAENLLTCHRDLVSVNLRLFSVYGSYERPDKFIQRALIAARDGSLLPVFGNGTQEREFTHVDDVCNAFQRVIQHLRWGNIGTDIFNIGGDNVRSLNAVLESVYLVTGRRVTVSFAPATRGDVACTRASCLRARSRLGWRPEIGFNEGLARQWETVKAQKE